MTRWLVWQPAGSIIMLADQQVMTVMSDFVHVALDLACPVLCNHYREGAVPR